MQFHSLTFPYRRTTYVLWFYYSDHLAKDSMASLRNSEVMEKEKAGYSKRSITENENEESPKRPTTIIDEEVECAGFLQKLTSSGAEENPDNTIGTAKKTSRNSGRELTDNVIKQVHLSSINALKTDPSQNVVVTEGGPYASKTGPEEIEKDSKLNVVLQRLSEYNKSLHNTQQTSNDSERHLVGTLENELADIITLMQNERVSQSQEITKLQAEIQRLNNVIDTYQKQLTALEKENSNTRGSRTSRRSNDSISRHENDSIISLEPRRNTILEAKMKGLE